MFLDIKRKALLTGQGGRWLGERGYRDTTESHQDHRGARLLDAHNFSLTPVLQTGAASQGSCPILQTRELRLRKAE